MTTTTNKTTTNKTTTNKTNKVKVKDLSENAQKVIALCKKHDIFRVRIARIRTELGLTDAQLTSAFEELRALDVIRYRSMQSVEGGLTIEGEYHHAITYVAGYIANKLKKDEASE